MASCFISRLNSSALPLLVHAHLLIQANLPCSSPAARNLQVKKAIRPNPIFSTLGCGRLLVLPAAAAAASGQDSSSAAATSTLVLQEVDFIWNGEATEVLLTGDFVGWDSKVPLLKGSDGAFHIKQKLSPGTYEYKFIVDGKWVHSPDKPTAEDGKGGFNNKITITDDASSLSSSKSTPSSSKSKPAANADATVSKPAAKAASTKPDVKKALNKLLPEIMNEDVIPKLKNILEKEDDIANVDLLFRQNQLEGSFVKNEVTYAFWAFFPDGKLEGSRGFSLSSHGSPPSTIEPFLIDEKKISADLLIFWITKRLFAQTFLSRN